MELFCSNRLCIDTVMMAFTGQSENLHIFAELFPLDNLYLAGKNSFAGQGHAVLLWGHPARNKQKQCMLGYGWESPPNMAVQ